MGLHRYRNAAAKARRWSQNNFGLESLLSSIDSKEPIPSEADGQSPRSMEWNPKNRSYHF
jgi:hypothetical protein